jgi:hypothetical protein
MGISFLSHIAKFHAETESSFVRPGVRGRGATHDRMAKKRLRLRLQLRLPSVSLRQRDATYSEFLATVSG